MFFVNNVVPKDRYKKFLDLKKNVVDKYLYEVNENNSSELSAYMKVIGDSPYLYREMDEMFQFANLYISETDEKILYDIYDLYFNFYFKLTDGGSLTTIVNKMDELFKSEEFKSKLKQYL